MSENLNCKNQDFSKYDEMTTEELEEILRLDAESREDEADTELLFYVMEVLARRRKEAKITGNTAQEAWKSFEENYMPREARNVKTKPIWSPWVRRVVAAAAVLTLLIVIPISAKAINIEKLWDVVATWAKETFSFDSSGNDNVDAPSPNRKDEVAALKEMIASSDRDASIVPAWIPDGFELEKIETDISPVQEVYRAFYSYGDKVIRIRVQTYLTDDFQKVEIEEGYSEIYHVAGIDYYLFENVDQCRAVWLTEFYECVISGDLSIDEIKLMIDSIVKG